VFVLFYSMPAEQSLKHLFTLYYILQFPMFAKWFDWSHWLHDSCCLANPFRSWLLFEVHLITWISNLLLEIECFEVVCVLMIKTLYMSFVTFEDLITWISDLLWWK